ncbi:hypothetical protein EG834_18175 [bacterium]|nr:hypothetical protein [bacterium]
MVKTTHFNDLECIVLENDLLQILVPKALGPRVLSLRFRGGENLLAELPDVTTERPDGKQYHFFGGHRLWLAPEDPLLSYALDDQAVEITSSEAGLLIRKRVESETGIEKSILLHLDPQQAKLTLTHRLTNRKRVPVEYAPWSITQFRTGGLAILPPIRCANRTLAKSDALLVVLYGYYLPVPGFGERLYSSACSHAEAFQGWFPEPVRLAGILDGWRAFCQKGSLRSAGALS